MLGAGAPGPPPPDMSERSLLWGVAAVEIQRLLGGGGGGTMPPSVPAGHAQHVQAHPGVLLAEAAFDLRCCRRGEGGEAAADDLERRGVRLLEHPTTARVLLCLLRLRRVSPPMSHAPHQGDPAEAYAGTVRTRGGQGPVWLLAHQRSDRQALHRFPHFSSACLSAVPMGCDGGGLAMPAVELAKLSSMLSRPPGSTWAPARMGGHQAQAMAPAQAGEQRLHSQLHPLRLRRGKVVPGTASRQLQTSKTSGQPLPRSRRAALCWESICAEDDLVRAGEPVVGTPALGFSEQGTAAFNRAVDAEERHVLALGFRPAKTSEVVHETDILRSCMATLQGLRSHAFEFCEADARFSWHPAQRRLRSCSSDCLAATMATFAQAGTCCARIEQVARAYTEGRGSHADGHMCRSFGRTLHSYLQHVRLWIHSQFKHLLAHSGPPTLVGLLHWTHCMRAQLVQVCALIGWPPDASHYSLPSGFGLLNRLHNAVLTCHEHKEPSCVTARVSVPSHWTTVALVLFTETLQPFLQFAQGWLYCGRAEDPFGEFMDQGGDHVKFLTVTRQTHMKGPKFLSSTCWSKLLRSGALIHMIQSYNPAHYLLTTNARAPTLSSREGLLGFDSTCATDDKVWEWLQQQQRRRASWKELCEANAERNHLLDDQRVAARQTQPTFSALAMEIRAQGEAASTARDVTATLRKQAQAKYATQLRDQIDNKRHSMNEGVDFDTADQIDRDADIDRIAELIKQEYATKIQDVEMRIARMTWQSRRFELQSARVRNLRQIADDEFLLLESVPSTGELSLPRQPAVLALVDSSDIALARAGGEDEDKSAATTDDGLQAVSVFSGDASEQYASVFAAHDTSVSSAQQENTSSSGPTHVDEATPQHGAQSTITERTAHDFADDVAKSTHEGPTQLRGTGVDQHSKPVSVPNSARPGDSTNTPPSKTIVSEPIAAWDLEDESQQDETHDQATGPGSVEVTRSAARQLRPVDFYSTAAEDESAFDKGTRLRQTLQRDGEYVLSAAATPMTALPATRGSGPRLSWSERITLAVPVPTMLQDCISALIEEQDRLVQSSAVAIFVHPGQLDILTHFRRLRNYLLLGSANFAMSLSSTFFDGIKRQGRRWVSKYSKLCHLV
jgi:hypothetical protein